MTLKQIMEQAPSVALKTISEGKRIEFGSDILSGQKTIKEMVGTDDGAREFVEKITYDVYSGRETVALKYKELYTTLTDANFPKTLVAEEFGPVQVVFLEKLEGGEIQFGTMGRGGQKVVSFKTYASGLEYNEDILEYNQTWRVSEIGVAFGEAYNKLLNHLHLSPIISATYATAGGGVAGQKAAQDDGTAQLVAFDTDVKTTFRKALQIMGSGSYMLINSVDRPLIEDAIAGSMLPDNNPNFVKRKLNPANIIEYDGDSVTVGNKTYEYEGVPAGFVYLITPKRNFREYIKHDLRVDSGDGDLSRLIITQIVGRARRAVLAGVGGKEGAVKIDIYA